MSFWLWVLFVMARLKIVKTKYKTLRDVVNAVRLNKVNYMDKVDMNNGA